MKSLSARRLALASVLSLSVSSALAQPHSDEPSVPVTLDSSGATLRLSSAAACPECNAKA